MKVSTDFSHSSSRSSFWSVFADPSLYALLFVNGAIGVWAVFASWPLVTLMWIYWCQSVIIGYFQYHRMMSLKGFSMEGVTFNGRSIDADTHGRVSLARFFVLHYGIFHLVYFIFLMVFAGLNGGVDVWQIALAAFGFYLNHRFSYAQQSAYRSRKPNIGLVMMYPYARILPLHMVIVLGFGFGESGQVLGLILFVVLKTLADAVMHMIEHRLWM